jgi:DNA-binding NtrC family response regulator
MVRRMFGHVLIVGDHQGTCEELAAHLDSNGYTTTTRTNVEDALVLLEAQRFDVIITTGAELVGMRGIDLCKRVNERFAETSMIVAAGEASIQVAVLAPGAGAGDFGTKLVDLASLLHRLRKAPIRADRHDHHRVDGVALRPVSPGRASTMIGESHNIERVRSMVARAAGSDISVLVTGESGVGKELVARELHDHGCRPDGPFVAVNCAAMPSELLESELFGHIRGAFTDAKHKREGLFLRASGGTLFLDEIGELPLETQPKLLRALQERAVRPVGGDRTVPFDARILAASNRDLESDVRCGRFREDLFYRVNVLNIHVPPLRARGHDVLLLAHHFLAKIAARTGKPALSLSDPAIEKMLAYDWPGNVRELENAMERAVALSRHEVVTLADLPDKLVRYEGDDAMGIPSEELNDLPSLHELERRYVRRVLLAAKGNKTHAAEVLGIARRTLYRWLDRLDLDDLDLEDSGVAKAVAEET